MTTTSNGSFRLTSSIVRQTRRAVRLIGGALILLMVAVFGNTSVKASTTEIIYSFAGDEDGEYLDTDVEIDAAGNLYGTSVLGGEFGGGTVWQLSPGRGWLGAYRALQFHGGRGWRRTLQRGHSGLGRQPLWNGCDRRLGEL